VILRALIGRSADSLPASWRLGDADWPIRLSRRADSGRITMRLCAQSDALRITAPTGCPERAIREALAVHAEALSRQARRLPPRLPFADGAEIPFRGARLRIAHIPGAHGGIDAAEGRLTVGGRPEHLPRRVRDLLIRAARTELGAACAEAFARAAPFAPRPLKAVRVADPRGRWGSCAADGTLRFSWRLILAPPDILSYVAAHEVAHLAEMSHDAKFWKIAAALAPDHASARAWLKRHGAALHRVGPPAG
jgi:predicted metal-dependent hydrolase